MQQFELKDLLKKRQAGTITPEEMQLLENWYLQWNPGAQEISPEDLQTVKNEIWRAISEPLQAKPIARRRLAVAAASLALITFIGIYFKIRQINPIALKENVVKDFLPGRNQATLTLSNGKKIILTNDLKGNLALQGNVAVHISGNKGLVYSPTAKHEQRKIVFNTLTTKKGEQSPYPLILEDGTKVWLNASSSITFPTEFTGKKREVYVEGEAYFEVNHRIHQPFFVHINNISIEDLGTHFNINGYHDENAVRTTLLEGAVKVSDLKSSVLIKPGEQAYSVALEPIKIRRVNTENEISWKNGDFVFNEKDLRSVMREISRWYDVQVVFDTSAPEDLNIDGYISKNRNISTVLKIIELTGKVHFKIERGKLIVVK